MPERDIVADRRGAGDRREGGSEEGRRGGQRPASGLMFVLRSLGLVVVLVGVIVFTVMYTRPIYTTSGTLGEELRKHAPGVAGVIAPPDSTHVDLLMATPKFQAEKRNFYEDVMRLKQVDSARADSIAQFAVREAYIRGISPAIIFGVMLTENSKFISKARSNVGAVGLMQVYPKVWLTKELSSLLGKDLVSDSTNVKYGVFILSQYFRPRTKTGETKERDWQTALLRYNGCVRGTNTPRCHEYPSKVQRFVEGSAKSICDGRGFYECIAKPFVAGLFGKTNGTLQGVPPAGTTATVSAGSVAAPPAQPAAIAPTPASAPVTAPPGAVSPSPAHPAPDMKPRSTAGSSGAGPTSSKVLASRARAARTGTRKVTPKTVAAAKKVAVAKKTKKKVPARSKAAKDIPMPKVPRINVIIPSP